MKRQSQADKQYNEMQADQLASAILMPKDATLSAWASSYSVDTLADIFEVPAKAVVIRLEMLGIHP